MPLDSQYSRLPKELREAAEYRQSLIAQAVRWTRQAWSINRPQDPHAWFATYADQYVEMVEYSQQQAATAAIVATDVALDVQSYNQPVALHADPNAFAGITGSGKPVMGLAYAQALKVAELIDAGAPATERARMWQHAGTMLAVATQTAISDASRMARLVHLEARPHTTWIRIVRPPCCARCAILAGKRGGHRMDFQRHPGCDCDAIPVSEETSDMHKLWHFDSKDYFDSLSTEQQNKIFTVSGAQAIRDGADINQVVNARRGMTNAGGEFSRKRLVTTEGTTKRGWASEYLREQYGARMQKSGGRYRRSSVNRLMPEEIYQIAGGDRDLALTLLHKNGYLTDTTPDLSGKWAWAKRDTDVKLAVDRMKAKETSISITSRASYSGKAGDGGKPPVPPPPEKATTGGGESDDELMRQFIEDRNFYDGRVPTEHIVVGEVKKNFIFGAHSRERREWAVEQVKNGVGIPPDGKTFFPRMKGRDEALRSWLGDQDSGVVRDVLWDPDRIEQNGRWGRIVYGIVEAPDGQKLELAVSIGGTRKDDPRTFKITSAYPTRGQGVSEVLADGTVKVKDFNGGEDGAS